MASLEDRLNQDVEGWRPEPGQSITGKVVAVDSRTSEYGTYPVIEIEMDDRSVLVHGFHTVLKNEIARLKPRPGDTIGIRYVGKDSKKDYEKYRVIVEPRDGDVQAPDWAAMEKEATDELASSDPDSF